MYLKISVSEYKELSLKVAEKVSDPVLFNWKLWMVDQENNIGVTVYYLNTKNQVEKIKDYLNTMTLLYHSFLEKGETEVYEILDEPSMMNFGPIDLSVLDQNARIIDT